jgi:hypothetical protein
MSSTEEVKAQEEELPKNWMLLEEQATIVELRKDGAYQLTFDRYLGDQYIYLQLKNIKELCPIYWDNAASRY